MDDGGRAPALGLAIDTAFEACSLAVFEDGTGRLVSEASERLGTGHAERLPALAEAALGRAGITFSDLSLIAVTVGPGSFTGIRVGVAAARGYGLALGIPALGIVTLTAMIEAVQDDMGGDSAVLAVHDARRGEVYAELRAPDGTCLVPPGAFTIDALVEAVRAEGVTGLDVTGSGAALFHEAWAPATCTIRSDRSAIDMAALARLAAQRQDIGGRPRPLYLRSADAKPPTPRFSLFAPAAS